MSSVIGKKIGSLLITDSFMENGRQIVLAVCICGNVIKRRLDSVKRSGYKAACSRKCYERRAAAFGEAWPHLFVDEIEDRDVIESEVEANGK